MSRKKPEIYQTFLASLKGGGVPPVWQKTKLFPVFSCEGFPKHSTLIVSGNNITS